MNLSDSIESRGEFWLPEEPENRFPGTLHISKSGVSKLEMKGGFGDPLEAILNIIKGNIQPTDYIMGEIEEGGPVTLKKCWCLHRNHDCTSGLSESNFLAESAFIGIHCDKMAYFAYSAFSFTVDLFNDIMSFDIPDGEEDLELQRLLARTPPLAEEEIPISLPNGDGMKFTLRTNLRDSSSQSTRLASIRTTEVLLSPKEAQPTSYFLSLSNKICNFLSLAVDQTVEAASHTGYLDPETEGNNKGQLPFEIFHQAVPSRRERTKEKPF